MTAVTNAAGRAQRDVEDANPPGARNGDARPVGRPRRAGDLAEVGHLLLAGAVQHRLLLGLLELLDDTSVHRFRERFVTRKTDPLEERDRIGADHHRARSGVHVEALVDLATGLDEQVVEPVALGEDVTGFAAGDRTHTL